MTITLTAGRGPKSTLVVLMASIVIAAALAVASPAQAATSSRSSTTTSTTPVLAQGAGMGATPSPAVRRVQRERRQRGYDRGRRGVDGRCGPTPDAAARRLQADGSLVADGIVGPRTRRVLGLARRR